MTDAEWAALAAYVERLRHDLLLDHWTIDISREPPDEDDGAPLGGDSKIDAQMHIQREANQGELRLHVNFRAGKPHDQRHAILHELLHLHVDTLFSDMTDLIEGFAAKQAFEAVDVLNRRSYERMTNALADAIAPKYDLPTWPDAPDADGVSDMTSEQPQKPEPTPPPPPAPEPTEPAGDADDDATEDDAKA